MGRRTGVQRDPSKPSDGPWGRLSQIDHFASLDRSVLYLRGRYPSRPRDRKTMSVLPTLRQLQYLKLLAERGSFSRAAEAAHVSQPALSSGVQELERVLGAPVVERTRGAVILTAVGGEAVRRAEDVLARTEALVEAAQNAGKPLSGRFRLGIIPTVAPFLLPRTLPGLKALYPGLRLFIREDLTPRLIAGLKAGQL